MRLPVSTVVLLCLLAAPTVALAQGGVRDSRDDAQILVNKDVGNERWAISYDRATGTITGNVFFPDGADPAFIMVCSGR